jgi:3-hydroxyacyl-CoA dehydrogenase
VIGAGTMGSGIALCFANAGIPSVLVDESREALERARTSLERILASAVGKGRIDANEAETRLQSVSFESDFDAVADSGIVVEAVFEALDLKREIFARLGSLCRPSALLATNTSTLDVDAIGAAAAHPERTLGLHFFSPAHVMKLLEIVRGARTSAATLEAARALGLRLGKIPVVVGNCDGFVGNRMLLRYRREAEFALLAGATPERVDAALERFGFAMGPFAVSDLAGIDIGVRAKRERAARGATPPFSLTNVPDELVAAGRLGQKSGAGYYRYEPGDRRRIPDGAALEPILVRERARLGVEPRDISDDEIVERCVGALVAEGARILDEGIAASPDDIDAIWVNGYGFPAARGGPMKYGRESAAKNAS